MSSQSPIQFHDLVAHKGQNAPLFSPNTIRARLAFAVKGIPIETVEVSGGESSLGGSEVTG